MLTGRQMGKSNLRVQTARRLQSENTAGGIVDITGIGTDQITPAQWYAGLTATLANSFKIKMNVRSWWRDREHLPPLLRLNEFIEQVLLPASDRNIVIFIDEIDSILSLSFSSDDFFAMLTVQWSWFGLPAISAIVPSVAAQAERVAARAKNPKKRAIITEIEALNSTADISLSYDQQRALIAALSAAKKMR